MSKNTTAHTYVVGEDEGRLASAAQNLGLDRDEGRMPKTSWANLLLNDSTLTAARMHSVGTLGRDERVDEYGDLHLMSIRRRRPKHDQSTTTTVPSQQQPSYDQLTDLFARPEGKESGVKPRIDEEREEGEDDEIIEDMVEGGSLVSAVFGIIKGTVGPAILYLPRGFYTSGYAVAIPAMIFATSMFIFNAYRLLDCWKVESDKNHKVETRLKEVQALLRHAGGQAADNMSGGGVTDHADSLALLHKSPKFGKNKLKNSKSSQQPQQYGATEVQQDHFFSAKILTYPELAKRALGPYSVIVELGIALFQFGVCLTYLIFVPDNLHQAVYAISGYHVPKFVLLWIVIAIEIPLSCIRDIRRLTTTNVIASFFILLGLGAVLCIAIGEGTKITFDADTEQNEFVFVQNLRGLRPLTETWFLFIGTSFFMMEGSITLLVPLQEAVYRPDDRAKFPDVNRNVTSLIVLFYILFSIIACAAFGSHIQTALTASLQGKLATFVQLAYSIAVILTFPLQAFPAMEVAIRMMYQATGQSSSYHSCPQDGVDWNRNMFAATIVLLLGVIAVCSINYLGNVVSILGSLFGIPLALVFPPLMHNALVKDSTTATSVINYAVVVIGFLAMASASFNTIVQWNHGAEG